MTSALKLGIKTPDSYYVDGKAKGKSSRDKTIDGGKTPAKEQVEYRKSDVNAKIDISDQLETEKIDFHFGKPSLSDMPGMVRKGKAGELPAFLDGFKHMKRK